MEKERKKSFFMSYFILHEYHHHHHYDNDSVVFFSIAEQCGWFTGQKFIEKKLLKSCNYWQQTMSSE